MSHDYTKPVVFMIFAVAAYFTPTAMASSRRHHNVGAIFALNLLLGWTIFGWVASLVWALTSQRNSQETS